MSLRSPLRQLLHRPATYAALISALATLSVAGRASAQMGPGQMPQPQSGPVQKPEGVAEQAPKEPGALPTTPVLPPPKSKKKKFELFQLDGYFRLRSDWLKNLNLGFSPDPAVGGAPFARPLACNADGEEGVAKPCEESLKSTNMRLRLEPMVSIDERASIHMQIDVLDNVVLGSNPISETQSGANPIDALSDTQVSPADAIKVKRAWAEVDTPLGLLKFGRMPSQWGMGIFTNAGGANSIHGDTNLDSDFGDSVDRVMFSAGIPGTDFDFAVATDWAATGENSLDLADRSIDLNGQPYDLEDNDDVNQWVFVISRMDSPRAFQEILNRGELGLNYGAYFTYRTQDWDYTASASDPEAPPTLHRRGYTAYIPDIWFHVATSKFDFEFEGVAVLGKIEELDDVRQGGDGDSGALQNPMDLRQFGAVGRFGMKLAEDKLKLGVEVGYASGDQWDPEVEGNTNVRDIQVLRGDSRDNELSAFRFNFDYQVDLILFRELLGTVTNATYVKPNLAYKLTDNITFSAQSVLSFANKQVATPGNAAMYGVELDGDLGYAGTGFFAGISYGVLFPMGALDHPCPADRGPDEFPWCRGETEMDRFNAGDATTAQTVQARLVLQF